MGRVPGSDAVAESSSGDPATSDSEIVDDGQGDRIGWHVVKPGETLTRDDVLQFLDGRVAKWWLPDDVVFVEAFPMTATGKVSKARLRERFKDHRLPTA